MTDQRGRVQVERGQKRVRVYLGGEVIADTYQPLLVWEVPYYPAYYIPAEDVRREHLVASGTTSRSPSRGQAEHFTVRAGGKEAVDAAWTYPDSPIDVLRDHIRLDWGAMDGWFEEDEEVFVHPRSPYSRVDTLASSRHVRVAIDGVEVADSTRPVLLFETGLPTRYYLPKTDVRMDRLTPTDKATSCPYKGTARYWSVPAAGPAGEDVAWSYPTPLPESIKVAGLVAFYNERVDLTVDGVLLERPRTPFS
jgi:uncharacterized protein (DUF427 family)